MSSNSPSLTTRQKLVLRILQNADRPVVAQEVWELAHKEQPSLGLATVYRALKKLQDEGLVDVVELEDQPPRYEYNTGSHHHHFYCRCCKQLTELAGCVGNIGSLLPKGFQMQDHKIVVYGLCDSCAA